MLKLPFTLTMHHTLAVSGEMVEPEGGSETLGRRLPGMKTMTKNAMSGCCAFSMPGLSSRKSMHAAQRWESWRLRIPDIQMPTIGCKSHSKHFECTSAKPSNAQYWCSMAVQ